jgi:hypothetical protein
MACMAAFGATVQADALISDFNLYHPFVGIADPGSGNWGGQIRRFNSGGTTGQEVTDITHETASYGRAFADFFDAPIDLSGSTTLSLTARLSLGNDNTLNTASDIRVTLFSGGSGRPNSETWDFKTSDLNTTDFRTILPIQPGANNGLDWAHVDSVQIEGDGFTQNDVFHVQFAGLSAVVAPEPTIPALAGAGMAALLCWRLTHRRRSE